MLTRENKKKQMSSEQLADGWSLGTTYLLPATHRPNQRGSRERWQKKTQRHIHVCDPFQTS